jgi:hypothetical protein
MYLWILNCVHVEKSSGSNTKKATFAGGRAVMASETHFPVSRLPL